MTSVSVMLGNVPLALALEPGSGSRSSLGIVIIGGVFSSLVLTLLLVPVVYVWLAPDHVVSNAAPPSANGKHPDPAKPAQRAPAPA
jgi:Cu/Ag efflux pump CusA